MEKLGNYANVKYYCISNGDGIGVSIYLSGCHFHCKGCQNSSIWNYDAGNKLTYEVITNIIKHMISNEHVNHLSILGGEPLDKKNLFSTYELVRMTKSIFNNKFYNEKKIWLWTGYTIEQLWQMSKENVYIDYIINNVDYLVDGQYQDENRDIRRKYSGSTNQRAIDMKKTIKNGEITVLEE